MITISDILNLKENDGMTLKNGTPIQYKTGWQVATEGIETADPRVALEAVETYGGNCGLWYSGGIYYVDKGRRVDTKKEALRIGKAHNQISIFGWKNQNLAYC